MKTEHEKLKEIIDVIGYECKFEYEDNLFVEESSQYYDEVIDVRQIIFTPIFKEKLEEYLISNYKNLDEDNPVSSIDIEMQVGYNVCFGLMENLNNPVEYLYNFLKLGTPKK